jgi:hypothetical protein
MIVMPSRRSSIATCLYVVHKNLRATEPLIAGKNKKVSTRSSKFRPASFFFTFSHQRAAKWFFPILPIFDPWESSKKRRTTYILSLRCSVARFFLVQYTKSGKSIPNHHIIHQMAITDIKWQ